MRYLFYEEEAVGRGRVFLIYYEKPPVDLLTKPHIEVPQLDDPEDVAGKVALLYCNPQTSEWWYEYADRPLTPEELMEQRLQATEDALLALMLGGAN